MPSESPNAGAPNDPVEPVTKDPILPVEAPPGAEDSSSGLSQEEIERLITDNMKLAFHFANQWSTIKGYDREDVIAQALNGLVKAANTYNPANGKFSSWASVVIRNYLGHINYHGGNYANTEFTILDAPPLGDEGDDGSMHDRHGAGGLDAGQDSARSEATDIVHQEIEALPSPDREMVKQWMNGKSYRDMQPEFGYSFMQIGNIVKRGLATIKASLVAKGITGIEDLWPESSLMDRRGKSIRESIIRTLIIVRNMPKA